MENQRINNLRSLIRGQYYYIEYTPALADHSEVVQLTNTNHVFDLIPKLVFDEESRKLKMDARFMGIQNGKAHFTAIRKIFPADDPDAGIDHACPLSDIFIRQEDIDYNIPHVQRVNENFEEENGDFLVLPTESYHVKNGHEAYVHIFIKNYVRSISAQSQIIDHYLPEGLPRDIRNEIVDNIRGHGIAAANRIATAPRLVVANREPRRGTRRARRGGKSKKRV